MPAETPQVMSLAPGNNVYTHTPFGNPYESRFANTTPQPHYGGGSSPQKNKSNSRDKYYPAGYNRTAEDQSQKYQMIDKAQLSEDEENDMMARFNRDRNQRSEFYESLKENHERLSMDKLPEIKSIIESTKIAHSNLYSPAKLDTLKMRKLQAKRGRSEARRAKLAIMESPEGSGSRAALNMEPQRFS